MRAQIVNFRAGPQLVAALHAQARRDGVSLSEVIRSAVRDKVAVQ